jgi:NAD(P)-dependent dehydrogenase (short-subunit alcohol dehydrogenase family)
MDGHAHVLLVEWPRVSGSPHMGQQDVGKITNRKEKSVMGSLEGKVAVVTGGNSGIGLATARAFHANGAKVVISGRDRETLEEVSRQLGHDVLAVQADVTKLSDIDQLMARAYETFGKLDILFVNAGIYIKRARKPLW